MKEIIIEEDWCYYSDLPSPMSYSASTDYDSIGNQQEIIQDTYTEGEDRD